MVSKNNKLTMIHRVNKQAKFKLIKLKLGLISSVFCCLVFMVGGSAYADSEAPVNNSNYEVNTVKNNCNFEENTNLNATANNANDQLETIKSDHPNNIDNGNQQISVDGHSYTSNGILYNTDGNNNVSNDNQYNAANNIGTINITGNFDQISKNNFKTVNINIKLGDKSDISTWAKIKWQGNSSQWWPKKGYRLKLYKDAELSDKYKIKLPGSGFKTNSFNLKANFNDPTSGVNIINSEIFKQITQSRNNLSTSIVNTMPNYGQITGLPVEVFINGLDQGLYTLNTYHEDKLYDLDDNKQDNIAIDGAGYSDATAFSRKIKVSDINDSDGFSIRSPQKATQSVCDRLNELYQLANAQDNEVYTELEKRYLDVPSAIDYLAFSFAINNEDGLRKNITYISKNGSKWVIMPYDLDSSWNIGWDGSLRPINDDFSSILKESGNLLLWNIYIHHKYDIINRYKELRENALSTKNVILLFNNWMQNIGYKNYKNNGKLWSQLDYGNFRHMETISPTDLFTAINQRLSFVDHEFGLHFSENSVPLTEYETKIRNIISIFPDGSIKIDKQMVKLNRSILFNLKTNQYASASKWQSDQYTFDNFEIPKEPGIHATLNCKTIENIPSELVSINTPDITNLYITYVKDGEKNGWVRQNGSYAFYDHNTLKKGLDYVQLDSLTRPGKKDWYLMKDGIVQSGIQQWKGSLYYFDPVSYLRVDNDYVKSQWGSYYLVGNDGIVKNGVQKWQGTYYYFDPITHLRVDNNYVQSQWGLWYMFGPNGQIVTGPYQWQGSLYYFDPSSYLVVKNDYRVPVGKDRGYLLGSDGQALSGVQQWMGTYYYFDPTTYLLVKNNYVQSQWGLWYMFGSDGGIVKGLYRWQGSLYYFEPSTYLMVKNKWIGNMYLGNDGRLEKTR